MRKNILLLLFIVLVLSLSKNSLAQSQPKYPMRERFGFVFNVNNCPDGCSERNIDEFPYKELGAGWYLDGGYGFRELLGGFRDDIEYVAMVGAGSRFNAPETIQSPQCNVVRNTVVNKYPQKYKNGMRWIIGNELGWDDQRNPSDYASEFVKWRDCIKSINSTFQVGSGAIIQPNIKLPDSSGTVTCVGIDNPQSGFNYFKNYINIIKNNYGSDKLPDFITFHGYTPCNQNNQSSSTNWANIDLLKNSIRTQRQAMKDVVISDKDLIVKEMGPLPHDATDNMAGYLNQAVTFLATEKDQNIGNPQDEGRLVQLFAWFVLNNWKGTQLWDHLELFDTNTTDIKPLGTVYKNIIEQYTLTNPTSDPCPRGAFGNQDLILFQSYFGKSIPGSTPSNQFSPNLFNDGSTIIDTADYEILRQNFNTCG